MKHQFVHVAFLAGILGAVAGFSFAQQALDPERRALFVTIVEANGCRMHNVAPSPGILEAISEHAFTREEVRAVASELLKTGDAVRDGEAMILKTENCS